MSADRDCKELLKKVSSRWRRLEGKIRGNREEKREFKREFEKFVAVYSKIMRVEGKPIFPREIIKKVTGENWKKLYYLIQDEWGGISYFFFERTWDVLGGEPIKRITSPSDRPCYVFKRFPQVYLSSTGSKPEIAFVPSNIKYPDTEEVGELTGIILCKGNAQVILKRSDSVNQILISGKKELLFRANSLVSEIFGVPKDFCRFYPQRRILYANSKMVGTYFQNVVGIFELDWDRRVIVTVLPLESFGESFKKGFVKSVINIRGTRLGEAMKIKDIWRRLEVLEVTREYLKELGFQVSEINPALTKQQEIIIKERGKNGLITGIVQSFALPGMSIFSKKDKQKIKVGEVVEIQPVAKFETIVRFKLKGGKESKIFVEKDYQFFIFKKKRSF